MQFHERLYEVRKRSGMTQNELAEKLNVSRQAVSRWEMGTAKPEFENLIALSDIFGISIDYLLKGNEDSAQEPPAEAASEATPAEDPDSHGVWEKLWLGIVLVFFAFSAIIGIGNGDLRSGFWTAIIIMVILGLLVVLICLIVIAVREILKRFK